MGVGANPNPEANPCPRTLLSEDSSCRCLKEIGMTERFTVHGLRRTFNDLMRRAGADGIVTRALTGHVTEGMTAHYSTVGFDEKQAAVAGVLSLVPLPKAGDGTGDGGPN